MKDLILGSHLYVARKGDVIDGITVAADAKPDVDPESNWTKLPCVEEWEPQVEREIVPRKCPSPGRRRLRRNVLVSQSTRHIFALQEWTETMFAELLLGGSKPAGGVFTPDGATELWEGWLKMQHYDQKDQLIFAADIWCNLTAESYRFQDGLETYTLQADVLYSELNTGALTNL